MSFSDEFRRESENAIKAVQEVTKVTAIEYFSGVIFRTPVGNPDLWGSEPSAGYTGGSARSNWFLTFSTPSARTTSSTNRDGGTRETFEAEITQAIASQRGGGDSANSQQYLLTNNLPYISRLDENWSSQTAGLGIVAPEVSRVTAMIPQIEAAANRRHGVQ